jgi:methylase of polypeptide subunit release factors
VHNTLKVDWKCGSFCPGQHGVDDGAGVGLPEGEPVRVLDVGCGANLIYPLLGAAMHGWCFVGVDIMDEAIQWAQRNRLSNPALAPLLDVRKVEREANVGNESGDCDVLVPLLVLEQ